jgi:hypothetical protein
VGDLWGKRRRRNDCGKSGARELNPSFKLGKLALNRSTSPAETTQRCPNASAAVYLTK